MIKGEVDVHSEQYKGADVSVRLALAGLEAKHFLIGILSLAEKNTFYIPHRSWKLKKFSGANQKADTQLGQAVISNYLFIQRGNEK